MRQRPALRPFHLSTIALFLAACSSDGGGSGDGFQLTRISLLEGAVWKVNQEIVFTFSDDVDFSSVSSNTISIQTLTGAPATGTFFLRDPNEIVFQPNCPTRANLSDTGLEAGNVAYVIRVLGRSSGASNTVRSVSGEPLDVTQVRNFTTPEDAQAFLDTDQGPPVPVVRPQGSAIEDATYIEVGGDPDQRVYFERDASQNIVLSDPLFETPLNLYSDPSSQIAIVIEFNQAVHPAADNVSNERMRLEFLDGLVWRPLETQVTLVANCTETGARVRLEPIGILPQGGQIRAVVLAGLQDLVGESSISSNENFAVAPTQQVNFTSLTPPDALSDEFPESFDFGGDSELSFQDTTALFASPTASWEDGRLTAAFRFEGSGGPGGAFDWLVREGDELLVDTDAGAIVASDDVTVQLIDDGVIDVRNMTIEAGGEVRVQGTRPLQINATGTVIIRGLLDVSGFNAREVEVNSGDVSEIGGAGGPGGGRGGRSNQVVTSSTARGSFGQGPQGELDAGGQGGESGMAPPNLGKNARRPGGGAGGRFALDQGPLVAQDGLPGADEATGAETGEQPPAGGRVSSGPFDGDPTNDFFGTKPVGLGGSVTGLIRGELPSLWGGYGGGGGGNALPTNVFPTPNWTPASDEKGGAGGGGGGGLAIRALGPIQFGEVGEIRSNGGRGAVGENVQQEDHIGGNGGSGSGGHVILETAAYIDFTDGNPSSTTASRDWVAAIGGPQITGAPTAAGAVSFGGAGGPGVVQLHVPDPLTPPSTSPATSDIVVPFPASVSGNPIDAVTSPEGEVLIPSFGARSLARSKWISIGGADLEPGGAPSLVQFLFGGTQTADGADEGKVLVSGGEVVELPALLDENLEGNANVTVLPDGLTLEITGTSLAPFALAPNGISNDIYLRTPALLEDFVLRLSVDTVSQDFRVASADYDEGAAGLGDEALRLTVADEGTDLLDFIAANTGAGTVEYQLVPRFFRILTGGEENALPATAFVRIRFQGTDADVDGTPDETTPLVDWTGDISEFNALLPGQLQFFRFEVEFDLGAVDADTQPVSLDFLRIPFVF